MGNQFLILLEIIGHGGYDFLVDRKELCILQCPMLEEVDPSYMVLDQEDAVVVPVVGTAILFQDAETFLEIRNFWIFRTCRNARNTRTVRTHLCLANIRDTCQAQYDYHDYLFQISITSFSFYYHIQIIGKIIEFIPSNQLFLFYFTIYYLVYSSGITGIAPFWVQT